MAPAAARAEYSPRRVTGDEGGAIDADRRTPSPRRAGDGQADGHQGRLGVLGQGQVAFGTFLHLGENSFWPKASSTLLEDLAGAGEGLGEIDAHADRLAALAREK
jgi:hypothetical protein